MKLSCAFVLTLTNFVIVSPFSLSVKGSGTSANAGATTVPATFGLVHNVPSKANGYSGNPPSPGSIGFTSRSESSSFGAFNYNSGHAHGSSEYIAPGEVSHNVATGLQDVVTAAVHANAESLANIKASGSYSTNKINNFSTNSASHFQYQPTTFESKPSSPFNVGQLTSINSNEHSKHVLITSKQSEKSDKFNQPSEVQSLPCQTFNSGSVIAEKSPVYNRGFGGPSGILTPENKATYIGSSSFSIQQSTTESVKPLNQSPNNEYNKPLDTDDSVKPELKPTASIKPLNNEKTKKDHFVTSSQRGQVSYIKDKNTLSSLGAKVPSTNEYSNEKVPANNFNGSKPIQNFQLFVQPYYGNVLPSSYNNIQNEKTFVPTNNSEKIKQTKEITYTGGFGAPTGVLKPFNQLQSSSHTFVSSEKLEQYETSKTNKVTTTETKESTVTTSSKKPLNEINVNDTPSTESTTYQLHENDSPANSYVTQKLTSSVYDEYSVTSDSPVLSTSKTHSNFFQLEHKEINDASQQPENNTFNPIVTSWIQDPTPSSSFSKIPVSYTIEKQVYVNSLDTKSAVSNSYDKLKPEKTEILISNQNKPVYTPIAATKLTPVSSWEQSSNNIPIKSNFENTQPSKLSETPKSFQSKYPLESGYTVAKVKQEISGESYSSELNPSTPVSATVVSTLLSGKPQFNDFLLFTTTKPPTASVNGANQYLVTSSAGFSSTSSEFSESHKISSTSDHTLAVINGLSEKAQKIPNKVINDFTYPTASVASLVNSDPLQSVHQSIPNLSISSTDTGTASVQSKLVTIAQQSSYEPSHEYDAPTASSILKISENPKVWSSDNALSIDYSSSSQKSNDVPNPTASVASQGNSNPIQSQNQINPNLSISSTNVGTSPPESTLVTLAQQSSYKPSHEFAAPTAGSIPKVSESRKGWSTKNPSSVDYSSSTQKPNNFANPTATFASQSNSNSVQSQHKFNPNLSLSSTNVGSAYVQSTLATFAQQSSYDPSHEYVAPTASSVSKTSENFNVWSSENALSIDYSSSTQKSNNVPNPSASVWSQGNSNPSQSQNQFNPNLSISSTNVGTSPPESTLVTLVQPSSYKPSHEFATPTASSILKISENPKVWSTKYLSSVDYSSSTQKPNNFANPTASVAPQGNSNPIQSQNQFKPSLPISSTNVGTSSPESTLVTLAQQSSYKPSDEFAAPTAVSIPKVSESLKVWSTENPSSIGYSSSTQKPNNFANPTATFTSQTNSNSVQSQHKFNPNLSLSSTNVGSAYVQSTLAAFAQQSSYDQSHEYVAPTASSVSKISENSNVWSSGNALSIDYSSSTQKSNNVPNPSASVGSQGNSNPSQSQNQFNTNLSISSTNVATSPPESTLITLEQQSSYKPSHEFAAPTAGSIPKVSESGKVWSTKNPSSIDYSSSTQKPNSFANPTTSVAPQGNSNPIQSQNQFKPSLPISSTNVGTSPLDSTLVAFAQQSSYKPSQEYAAPTAGSIPKVPESPKVWSTKNPLSIDYSSSTQKPNNFANPTASVAPQGNSNPIQSQNQFKPSLPILSTNVGTSPVDSTLVAFAQQSSYKPSQEYAAHTAGSIPKVPDSPKVWSTKNPLSIDYSSSTQKPNNFANPTTSFALQGNSNPIQSQNQFKPSLPISSTNVGTSPPESTLVTIAQQSSYKPSDEFAAPTAGSVPRVSESPKVWSTENPSSISYSSSTQKPNNFANPTATFASQTNSNFVQSQHKFKPSLPISLTNVGSAYVQSTLATFAQQSTHEPSIENSSIDSVVRKVSENIEVFPENPSFIDNNSSTQKPNKLTYSGTSSNSYIKESELQSSTASTVGNVTPNKPLYSNTFGTLTGALKPSDYSHSIASSFPSSISNSNYDSGLVSVSNVKLGQSNYFSQYKPAVSGFKEKTTTLSSLYPTDSIYVSTAKPYVTPASSNIAQQSTELNQEISKFSSSLHSATKPTQGPKQQLNNNGVSTVSLLTPSTIKPTSAVFPTSRPVFVAGSSQSKPQYQYSTVQPATQKKQWYTNTFETFGGVKPQSSYTYPGFTSSFSNFGYGSSIVANKQFTRVPLTGQYKQPSTGQYNPISSGLYKPTSTGQYYPTSTGQYYPTSTGQYNPTLTNQYKPYNWGFSRQPATLKPSGQIAPAGDLISTADAPKSSTSLEKSKFNNGFSILNQKGTSFASGFSSPSVSHTTLKPISSIEEYSGNPKITPFISTTPKTNTQKPWSIASQATTHEATNLLETSDSVTSQFFNGEKPTVAPYSVVPSPNPPSNILPSSEKPVEYFYINNSEPVSDIPKHTSQLSYDKKDNNSFEQISSTTPKIVGLIKPTSSVNFVVQTSSSLSAGSVNTKNSQLTTSNYGSQQTLNQNNIQIDSSLSTTSPGQEANGPKTEFLSNGISSVGYDTSSPQPSSVPFFTNLNFPFTKPSNAPHKSEYTSVSGVSTVVLKPPKKLSESIVPNYSSAVSTENNYSIISDKEEVKDQVTSISGFQYNPLVYSNSFNSVIPSKLSAKSGQNISSKPQDQSIVSQNDSLLAENQGKLDINVKPTNLHSSSTIQLPGSIYNSSNQQKPTATVSLPAQSEDARTVYQKPLSQHSSLFHSGTIQLSKPNIKITVINPPSSSTLHSQYVGSFGGPSGLLKPNDFSGPFVQANVPSQKNLSHQNQPAFDINSGIKVAEHSKLGSYSGGFGGPPGVLKPDNSEIHTGVFYTEQDKQSPNVETSGLHGSLTIHNLSPSAPSVGSYTDIEKQNFYSLFIPTKPNKAVSTNSEGLANSKVESYNQQHSGIVHDSGNTKSTSSFTGQFGKVNSLTTIASVEASAEAGAGPFGLKRAFTSGLPSAHSSGLIANTDHGSKIF